MKTRVLLIVFLMIILSTGLAYAKMPTIKADKQYFDISTGLHILSGNVYIEHHNRIITAGEAKTNLIELWASGGATFNHKDISFTGNTVYVNFTKNLAQISGACFSRTNLQISADTVDYDWQNKVAVFSGNVTVTKDGISTAYDSITYHLGNNEILSSK